MAELQNRVAGLRRFGAASLDMAFVAAGRLDGYWERNLQPWDMAAGQIMVREAGGVVTTWDGGPAEQGGNCLAAATPELHAAAMKVLRG